MKKQLFIIVSLVLLYFTSTLNAQVHYKNTIASQDNSSAIGQESVATGDASFASGFKTTASGAKSTALGLTSIAEGVGSTTLGIDNLAIGHYSVTIGSNLKAAQGHSIVIGSGYSNYFRLINNNTYSLMVGFRSQYPTLFVGTSPEYNKTGSIAIGNVVNENGFMDPQAKLHIRADAGEEAAVFIEPHNWGSGEIASLYIGDKTNGVFATSNKGLFFNSTVDYTFGSNLMFISQSGNVGIGTNQTGGYKLTVNGKILAEELKITGDVPGSDYVFDKSYNLLPLYEVEKYISKNKHLPEVKSAEDFKTEGYKVGEMDDLLLRKIEELTLYIIKQQKMIEKQAKILEAQQKQIDELTNKSR